MEKKKKKKKKKNKKKKKMSKMNFLSPELGLIHQLEALDIEGLEDKRKADEAGIGGAGSSSTGEQPKQEQQEETKKKQKRETLDVEYPWLQTQTKDERGQTVVSIRKSVQKGKPVSALNEEEDIQFFAAMLGDKGKFEEPPVGKHAETFVPPDTLQEDVGAISMRKVDGSPTEKKVNKLFGYFKMAYMVMDDNYVISNRRGGAPAKNQKPVYATEFSILEGARYPSEIRDVLDRTRGGGLLNPANGYPNGMEGARIFILQPVRSDLVKKDSSGEVVSRSSINYHNLVNVSDTMGEREKEKFKDKMSAAYQGVVDSTSNVRRLPLLIVPRSVVTKLDVQNMKLIQLVQRMYKHNPSYSPFRNILHADYIISHDENEIKELEELNRQEQESIRRLNNDDGEFDEEEEEEEEEVSQPDSEDDYDPLQDTDEEEEEEEVDSQALEDYKQKVSESLFVILDEIIKSGQEEDDFGTGIYQLIKDQMKEDAGKQQLFQRTACRLINTVQQEILNLVPSAASKIKKVPGCDEFKFQEEEDEEEEEEEEGGKEEEGGEEEESVSIPVPKEIKDMVRLYRSIEDTANLSEYGMIAFANTVSSYFTEMTPPVKLATLDDEYEDFVIQYSSVTQAWMQNFEAQTFFESSTWKEFTRNFQPPLGTMIEKLYVALQSLSYNETNGLNFLTLEEPYVTFEVAINQLRIDNSAVEIGDSRLPSDRDIIMERIVKIVLQAMLHMSYELKLDKKMVEDMFLDVVELPVLKNAASTRTPASFSNRPELDDYAEKYFNAPEGSLVPPDVPMDTEEEEGEEGEENAPAEPSMEGSTAEGEDEDGSEIETADFFDAMENPEESVSLLSHNIVAQMEKEGGKLSAVGQDSEDVARIMMELSATVHLALVKSLTYNDIYMSLEKLKDIVASVTDNELMQSTSKAFASSVNAFRTASKSLMVDTTATTKTVYFIYEGMVNPVDFMLDWYVYSGTKHRPSTAFGDLRPLSTYVVFETDTSKWEEKLPSKQDNPEEYNRKISKAFESASLLMAIPVSMTSHFRNERAMETTSTDADMRFAAHQDAEKKAYDQKLPVMLRNFLPKLVPMPDLTVSKTGKARRGTGRRRNKDAEDEMGDDVESYDFKGVGTPLHLVVKEIIDMKQAPARSLFIRYAFNMIDLDARPPVSFIGEMEFYTPEDVFNKYGRVSYNKDKKERPGLFWLPTFTSPFRADANPNRTTIKWISSRYSRNVLGSRSSWEEDWAQWEEEGLDTFVQDGVTPEDVQVDWKKFFEFDLGKYNAYLRSAANIPSENIADWMIPMQSVDDVRMAMLFDGFSCPTFCFSRDPKTAFEPKLTKRYLRRPISVIFYKSAMQWINSP